MAEEIITSTNAETATDHEYNASEIQVLKGLEAVRKRPGMYIGSTGERGLHHLVYEIVDNAIDEALAGYCDHIEVKILKDNIIQVTDNGRGIPVDIQADTGLPAVTVVYTILHAGGKFGGENSGYKVAGGLHGVGASVVNACSEWLTVNVRRDGHEYEQTFRRGDPDGPLKCIGPVADGVTGTRVTFKPDPEMFDTLEYDYETLHTRMREQAFLNAGLRITITDARPGKEQSETFRRGDPDGALKCIGTVAEGVTGTRVTFKPDPEMFKDTTVYDFDTLEKRLREESFLNAGVKITLTDERERMSGEMARLAERKTAAETELNTTASKLWEEYQLTEAEAEKLCVPFANVADLRRQVAEVRGKIRALGNVNVGAIEEYKEVKERYDFMKAQVTDVEKSRTELNRMIAELCSEMQEMFTASFKEINRNFGAIFRELFGGGSARLYLSDENDVLNSGIEIQVSPPGKVIKNLSALSGGEQALVAISIYFAILAVNPSPFCILDEIEAALDDVNVTRYAQYLRRMTERTQFIVITHRRGTMEAADVLYGVTMQEDGVSKILRLDLENVSADLIS